MSGWLVRGPGFHPGLCLWSQKGAGVSREPRQPFFQQLLLLSLDPRSAQPLPGTTANVLEPWAGLGSAVGTGDRPGPGRSGPGETL